MSDRSDVVAGLHDYTIAALHDASCLRRNILMSAHRAVESPFPFVTLVCGIGQPSAFDQYGPCAWLALSSDAGQKRAIVSCVWLALSGDVRHRVCM